jgi:hypothetical protein
VICGGRTVSLADAPVDHPVSGELDVTELARESAA